jgi:putative membrane protein
MKHLPAILLVIVTAVLIWSGIGPYDRGTWYAEVAPVLIVLPLLVFTRKTFPLTPLLYVLIALHCCVLLIGGHYTYALTPMGEWMRDILGTERNPYDRLGHLMQGFVPAIAIRELLLRTSPLKAGKWLAAIIWFSCMGIAACYEIIEWWAALAAGQAADGFLGAQGDVWDTCADMLCCGIGAALALLALSRWHNRQLATIASGSARL